MKKIARRLIRPSETLEGYEQPELIEVVFRKTRAYNPQSPWPEIAGATTVLDFGGGCGLHYKEARSATVRWAVIDSPAMVARAKELATDRLQFFTDIAEAAGWLGSIDVMHSNGALQCAPEPEGKLRQLCALRAGKMLWSRTWLSNGETAHEVQSSFLGDNGPGSLDIKEKMVRYPIIRIPEQAFLDAHAGYMLAGRGADWFNFLSRSHQ